MANLAKARARLAAHGVDAIDDEAALPIRRCYIHDPFGNRIELIDASDAGFTAVARRGPKPGGDAASG